ncbi:MAG: hypothetical protein AMXMBFR84_07350 [Candidatus Hydrogenedentota bacterium]
MSIALAILGWTTFGLAILIGILLDLLGLFGNWIILGAMAALWAITGFDHFGWIGMGGMLALAILGEILETLAAGFGASKFGGGKGSIVAALVGCLLGAVFGSPLFPIVGTLIGAMVGAFAGATLYEYIQMEKQLKEAAWTGFGAALGKVAGLFAKTFAGFAMLLVGALTY